AFDPARGHRGRDRGQPRRTRPPRIRGHRQTADPGLRRCRCLRPLLRVLRPHDRVLLRADDPDGRGHARLHPARTLWGDRAHRGLNYPLQLIGRAAATSLATGNCAVAKPADETPRSTVRLAELIHSVGFPAGAFNVVTGLGAEAGAALSAHPGVAHLGFVGSTRTGSAIAHAAAE